MTQPGTPYSVGQGGQSFYTPPTRNTSPSPTRCGRVRSCTSGELRQQVELVQKEIEMTKEALAAAEDRAKEEIKVTEEAAKATSKEIDAILVDVGELSSQVEKLTTNVQAKEAELVTIHTANTIETEHLREEIVELRNAAERERFGRLQLSPQLNDVNNVLNTTPNRMTDLEKEQMELQQEIELLKNSPGGCNFVNGTDMLNFEIEDNMINFPPTPDFVQFSPNYDPMIELSPRERQFPSGRPLPMWQGDTPSPIRTAEECQLPDSSPSRSPNHYANQLQMSMARQSPALPRPRTPPPQFSNYDAQQWSNSPSRRPRSAGATMAVDSRMPNSPPIRVQQRPMTPPLSPPLPTKGNNIGQWYEQQALGQMSPGQVYNIGQGSPVAEACGISQFPLPPPLPTNYNPGQWYVSPNRRMQFPRRAPTPQEITQMSPGLSGQPMPASMSPPIRTNFTRQQFTTSSPPIQVGNRMAYLPSPPPLPSYNPQQWYISPNSQQAFRRRPPQQRNDVDEMANNVMRECVLRNRPPTPPPLPNYNAQQYYISPSSRTCGRPQQQQQRNLTPPMQNVSQEFTSLGQKQSPPSPPYDTPTAASPFGNGSPPQSQTPLTSPNNSTLSEYETPLSTPIKTPPPPSLSPPKTPTLPPYYTSTPIKTTPPPSLSPPKTPTLPPYYTNMQLSECPVGPNVDGFCPCTQMSKKPGLDGSIGIVEGERGIGDESFPDIQDLSFSPMVNRRLQSPLLTDESPVAFQDMSFSPPRWLTRRLQQNQSPQPVADINCRGGLMDISMGSQPSNLSFSPIQDRRALAVSFASSPGMTGPGLNEISANEFQFEELEDTLPQSRSRVPSPEACEAPPPPLPNTSPMGSPRGIGLNNITDNSMNFQDLSMSFGSTYGTSPPRGLLATSTPRRFGGEAGIMEEGYDFNGADLSFSPIPRQESNSPGLGDISPVSFKDMSFSPPRWLQGRLQQRSPVADINCRGGLMDVSMGSQPGDLSFSPIQDRRLLAASFASSPGMTGPGLNEISANEFQLQELESTPPPQTMSPFQSFQHEGVDYVEGGDLYQFSPPPLMGMGSPEFIQLAPKHGTFPIGKALPFSKVVGRDYGAPRSPPLPKQPETPPGMSPYSRLRWKMNPYQRPPSPVFQVPPPRTPPTPPQMPNYNPAQCYVAPGQRPNLPPRRFNREMLMGDRITDSMGSPEFEDMSFASDGQEPPFIPLFLQGAGIEEEMPLDQSDISMNMSFFPRIASTPTSSTPKGIAPAYQNQFGGLLNESMGPNILQDLSFSPIVDRVQPSRFNISGNQLCNVSPPNYSFEDIELSPPGQLIADVTDFSLQSSFASSIGQPQEGIGDVHNMTLASSITSPVSGGNMSPISPSNRVLTPASTGQGPSFYTPPPPLTPSPIRNFRKQIEEINRPMSANAVRDRVFFRDMPSTGIQDMSYASDNFQDLSFSPQRGIGGYPGQTQQQRTPPQFENQISPSALLDDSFMSYGGENRSGEWCELPKSQKGLSNLSGNTPEFQDMSFDASPLVNMSPGYAFGNASLSPSSLLNESDLVNPPFGNDFSFASSLNGQLNTSGPGILNMSGNDFMNLPDMSFSPIRDGSRFPVQTSTPTRRPATPIRLPSPGRQMAWEMEDLSNESGIQGRDVSWNMSGVSDSLDEMSLMGMNSPPPRPKSAGPGLPIRDPRDLRSTLPPFPRQIYASRTSPASPEFPFRNVRTPPQGSPQMMQFSPDIFMDSPGTRPVRSPRTPVGPSQGIDLRRNLPPNFNPYNPNIIHFSPQWSPESQGSKGPVSPNPVNRVVDMRQMLTHRPELAYRFQSPVPASPSMPEDFNAYTAYSNKSPDLFQFSPDRTNFMQFSPTPDMINFSPNGTPSPNQNSSGSCARTR